MILREGAAIVTLGAIVGLAGAFALRQTMQSQLYEISPMDARVVATVAGMLLIVATVACLVPARRAAKTNPVIALTD
jgi:putative ABC transport system permease protein